MMKIKIYEVKCMCIEPEFTAKVQGNRNYVEYKGNTFYDDPKDNTAFERCFDIMSRLILKYGLGMLEDLEKENGKKYKKRIVRKNNML